MDYDVVCRHIVGSKGDCRIGLRLRYKERPLAAGRRVTLQHLEGLEGSVISFLTAGRDGRCQRRSS